MKYKLLRNLELIHLSFGYIVFNLATQLNLGIFYINNYYYIYYIILFVLFLLFLILLFISQQSLLKKIKSLILNTLLFIIVFFSVNIFFGLTVGNPVMISGGGIDVKNYEFNKVYFIKSYNPDEYTLRIGEVIMYKNITDSKNNYIGRIVALPGDTVKISKDKVLVNNNDITNLFNLNVEFESEIKISLKENYFVVFDKNNNLDIKQVDNEPYDRYLVDHIIGKERILGRISF